MTNFPQSRPVVGARSTSLTALGWMCKALISLLVAVAWIEDAKNNIDTREGEIADFIVGWMLAELREMMY